MSRPAVRAGAAAGLALAVSGSLGASAVTAADAAPAPAKSCTAAPTISKEFFGKAMDTYAGKKLPVYRYTLANCHGMQVRILTYGGIVQSIDVPGRGGRKADVVLGFRTLNQYVSQDSPPPPASGGPYFGEIIGRYANRIAGGKFTLDGKVYHVPVNNGPNSLHGGLVGFGNHVWAAAERHGTGTTGLQLTLVSPDGDQGYPGQLTLVVTYTMDNSNQLAIHYHATTTAPTVVNFTNHSYFNLGGESSGAVYAQKVYINADRYTPTNSVQIPTGIIAPVKGTPFDFTTPHTIGSRINENNRQLLIAQGYDHNWVLNRQGMKATQLSLAARAWDDATGRELTVYTNEPGVQFYTGNFLNGTLVGISGHIYRQSDGYTFETQHFPNSPNQPNFPTTTLNPGKSFNSTTIFQFSSF